MTTLWPEPSQIIGKPSGASKPSAALPVPARATKNQLWPDPQSVIGKPAPKSAPAAPNANSGPTLGQQKATADVIAHPDQHVFNPKNPSNAEFNKQLDMRAPSTSVFKNFIGSIPAAAETVVSTLKPSNVKKSLLPPPSAPKSGPMAFPVGEGLPNTGTGNGTAINAKATIDKEQVLAQQQEQLQQSLGAPNMDLKKTATDFAQFTPRAVASLAASLLPEKHQNEFEPVTSGKLIRYILGDEKIQPLARQVADTEINLHANGFDKTATPLALIGVIGNETLGLYPLISPLSKAANSVLSDLADFATKESSIKITFSDAQKIVNGSPDVDPLKLEAFKKAANDNPNLLKTFKQGGLIITKSEDTPLSAFLKNATDKPVQEAIKTPLGTKGEPVFSQEGAIDTTSRVVKPAEVKQLPGTVASEAPAAEAPAAALGDKEFSQNYVNTNLEKAKADYSKHIMEHYGVDNIVSTDDAKAVIPKYNGVNSDEYQAAAGKLTQQIYADRLVSQAGKGNNEVLFTAGGTGAGKTTALKNGGVHVSQYPIVYDTNMNNFGAADSKIQAALDHGFKVDIRYVYRDPAIAYEHGVIPRIGREGRVVTAENHIKTHQGSLETIPQLMEKYKDNPNVKFKVYDNSELNAISKQVSIDKLPKHDYNYIKGQLHEQLHIAKSESRITAEQHARAVFEAGLVRGESSPERKIGTGSRSKEKFEVGTGPIRGNHYIVLENAKKELARLEQKGIKAKILKHEVGPKVFQYEVVKTATKPEKVADLAVPERISSQSTKDLVNGLRDNGGHPNDTGDGSDRYDYLRTLQERGYKKVLEDLGYSADPKTVWYNENTGTEETLGQLLGLTAVEEDHVVGLPREANHEIPFVLENWHPLNGKNPITSKVAKLSEKDVLKTVVNHYQNSINRAGSLAAFVTDANNGGGTLRDIGSVSGGKGKIKVTLHDGREFTFATKKVWDASKAITKTESSTEVRNTPTKFGVTKTKAAVTKKTKDLNFRIWDNHNQKLITPVLAKPVELPFGNEGFVAKTGVVGDQFTQTRDFVVYEKKSGIMIARARTKAEAVEKAVEMVKEKGREETANAIEEGIKLRQPEEHAPAPKVKASKNESLGFNPKNLDDLNFQPEKFFDPKTGKDVTKEVNKVVKRSEIAKALSEKLDVPIRRGKFRMRGAIGIFKPGPKVVRIKKGGLPTVFHEVGHFLDDKFNFSDALDVKERQALMVEYGNKYLNEPKKQMKEGFAEYMRFIMTGQEDRAAELAPKFDKAFKERIQTLPEIKDVLDVATADYKRWQEQPATAKILSHISLSDNTKASLSDRITNNLHTFYTMALDDLHPLAEFSALAKNQGVNLPSESDPYVLARNMRGWIGKADTFLTKGTFGKNYWEQSGGKVKAKFNGPSFTEIMKPVEKSGALDDFRVYLVAKRTLELAGREKPIAVGIQTSDAQAALDELEAKYPKFEETAAAVYKYQDDLLNFAGENGLVGPKGLERIKALNKFRVPFYRVMETERSGFMGGKKIAGNLSSPIKKIKGSEREIIDPIESIIKDTYAIINSSERNNIGVAMANLSKTNFELGRLFEQVDKPMKPVTVNVKEVMDKMAGIIGIELPENIQEELGDMAVTLFRPTLDAGPNMLNVNIGDKSLVFQVDPDLFKSIQGLNAEDLGVIVKILAAPARLLRAGATLSPDFAVRNPLRDQFSAMVYSKFGYKPGYDLVRGVFELFKKGDVYNLWKMAGGEHSMMVSLDRDYLQSTFEELVRSKGGVAFHYLKHPIDALRLVSEIGEQATRLGEMRRGLAAGANPIESAFASREVTLDFARIGAKTKAINSIVAFWNANVQGLDKMARSFKDHPFRTSFRAFMGITLPSILLYYANRKDPRWKEIPQWQKDLFWIVMTKNHIYRIPKPFELGILFGSVPERILEFMDTHDKNLFGELESSVANGATPGFIPTALVPIIENITNYSFFLNRPIVSQGKQALPPEAQFGTYTTEIAKLIGNTVGYSPSKIDNLIQGYSGGLGKYAAAGVDKVLEGTGISKPAPAPAADFESTPILKAFMIQPPSGTNSESVNRLYTMGGQAAGELTYVKKLFDEGEKDKAAAYVKDHPELVYNGVLSHVLTDFSNINNARDKIRGSKAMSPQDKADKIKQLDDIQTKIAQQILKQIGK